MSLTLMKLAHGLSTPGFGFPLISSGLIVPSRYSLGMRPAIGSEQKLFVIGLAQEEASKSNAIVQTLAEIAAMKSRSTDIWEVRTKQSGVRSNYKRCECWLNMLSISRSDWSDEVHEQLADRIGEEPFEFLLFNELAMTVANAHFADLPPVLLEIDASDLPANLRQRLHILYPEVVPVESRVISAQ